MARHVVSTAVRAAHALGRPIGVGEDANSGVEVRGRNAPAEADRERTAWWELEAAERAATAEERCRWEEEEGGGEPGAGHVEGRTDDSASWGDNSPALPPHGEGHSKRAHDTGWHAEADIRATEEARTTTDVESFPDSGALYDEAPR
ncbi:hypothetical protein ZWY2020_028193 [Hordeum vulgare]|nr:hypothetical protein ZWY2020_028193 [Hordeum vulgare]